MSGAILAFFRMIFGDFNAEHFTAHNSIMGEVFFVGCLVTANLILLNILIAVVGHEYNEQQGKCQQHWHRRMIAKYEAKLRLQLNGGGGVAQLLCGTLTVACPCLRPVRRCCARARAAGGAASPGFAAAHYVIDRDLVCDLRSEREPPPTLQSIQAQLHELSAQVAALGVSRAPRGYGDAFPRAFSLSNGTVPVGVSPRRLRGSTPPRPHAAAAAAAATAALATVSAGSVAGYVAGRFPPPPTDAVAKGWPPLARARRYPS